MKKPPYKVLREDITILITNQCGNYCKHCMPESGIPLSNEMTAAAFIRFLPKLRTVFGTSGIALTGGEPLLKPGFSEIYMAATKNFEVTLFSSGIGLTSNLMALFREIPPKRFIASLYGLPASHDAFCNRNGAFSCVERCLSFFRKIGSPTIVNLVCHRGNLTEIKQVIVDLQSHELVDAVKILAFSPVGRGRALGPYIVKNSEWIMFIDDLQTHFLNIDKGFGKMIEVERHVQRIDHRNKFKPKCCSVSDDGAGEFSSCIHIDANGDMFPCVMLLRNPVFRFGNIRDIDTLDLRNYYKRVRIELSSIKNQHCAQCGAAKECAGGCLGYHLTRGKDHRCEDSTFDIGCPTRYESLFLPLGERCR